MDVYRYRFGTAEFDQSGFILKVGGVTVELERRPLEVLGMLLTHAGEVVTKQELLDNVWAGRVTVEHVVPNAMTKLRRALGDNAGCIVTQPRVGYRFQGELERTVAGRRLASQLSLAAGEPVPGREEWVLHEQLRGARENEIWIARRRTTPEQRVFKFCIDADGLSALKREATLSRVLHQSLGERGRRKTAELPRPSPL